MARALPLRVVGGAAPGLGEGPAEVLPSRTGAEAWGRLAKRPAASTRLLLAGEPGRATEGIAPRKQWNKKGEQLEPLGVRHPWN
ncbi:hypothetical protein [Streptomyces noursei]|uniref:hypothetical protein n=1 Tax=Streptomyces noursei TaxID=1971 RepID=UPI0023B7D247|nr:hypothetical protein [Streptomyces noursei]